MAITLTTAARNAACDAIVDLVDAGAATGAGTLEIKSSASTVAGTNEVATLTFSEPAFAAAGTTVAGRADAGQASFEITDDASATGGTAGFYTVFDSDGTAIWQGTVSTSGADLNLSSTTIAATESVAISSFTLTVPATA